MYARNALAFCACVHGDKATARRAFKAIGSDWEPNIWHRYAAFQAARRWAGKPVTR